MWAIKRYQWVLIGIFVFYLIMSMLTPLIHDDLQWANPYGIEMLNEGFQSLNGRYLGNLLEIIAVRLPLFRYITYSVFALLIIRIIFQYIVDMKRQECERSFTYLTIFMFILMIPTTIYSQIYGWFAGFYNYVPATLCSLYILRCSLKLFEGWHLTRTETFACVTVALLGQWFMENMTLFNVAIVSFLLIGLFYKYKHIPTRGIAIGVSTLLGALTMFMNPNYLNIFAGRSNYQKVSDDEYGIWVKMIGTFGSQFPDKMIFQPIIILLILAIILMLFIQQSAMTKSKQWLPIAGLFSAPLYTILVRIPFDFETKNEDVGVAITNVIVALIYYVALNMTLMNVLPTGRLKRYCLILLWAIPVMVAPLLIVQPIGPRNFYAVYMIYVIITMALFSRMNFRPHRAVVGLTCSMALGLIVIFSTIFVAQTNRIQALETALQDDHHMTAYTVERLPFESFMQHSSPYDQKKTNIFKTYWGVPEYVKLNFK